MKTIIVATDFSKAALNAAKFAAGMASEIKAGLLLLHVFHMPAVLKDIPVAKNAADMQQDAEKELDKIKQQLAGTSGTSISIEARSGSFFPELEAVCKRENPYAVIMGSQGHTAAERMLFGSHTLNAMKQLKWPLIAVPLHATFSTIKKIGLACDLVKVAETIPVQKIKTLLKDLDAELHILNTGSDAKYDPENVIGSETLIKLLGDIKPQFHFLSEENKDSIIAFADKNQIDLLVVLPKKHSFIEKLLQKSHTKQLVMHSHVPVMVMQGEG